MHKAWWAATALAAIVIAQPAIAPTRNGHRVVRNPVNEPASSWLLRPTATNTQIAAKSATAGRTRRR